MCSTNANMELTLSAYRLPENRKIGSGILKFSGEGLGERGRFFCLRLNTGVPAFQRNACLSKILYGAAYRSSSDSDSVNRPRNLLKPEETDTDLGSLAVKQSLRWR